MKSSTMNVKTSIIEEVFHEVSESFHGESSSSSLNDDVQQSLEEVIPPQTNTQSISINMIPNGDEASTSHNVFNERLEDAYFDASTSFHDPSNVQTFYQPYPHEKKWTKDPPLYKIIALRDADWVSAMQEELDQFARLKVWRLVPRPEGKSVIKTKWIFKNKKDESSWVIRNKARLVSVGYSQQEGIDYDEMFAPVARIEAIRFFLAYATHKDFTMPKIPKLKSFITLDGELTQEDIIAQVKEKKRLADLKAEKEKSKESLKRIMNLANIKAQAQKIVEYEAKRTKMLKKYNDYINQRVDELPITKISYSSSNDATMRITRGNDPLNDVVHDKFRLKTLSFSKWLEVHALASETKSK
nr:hypothetical protein [Tanacetum cinerariifolium]